MPSAARALAPHPGASTRPARTPAPGGARAAGTAARVLALQRQAGNAAVAALVRQARTEAGAGTGTDDAPRRGLQRIRATRVPKFQKGVPWAQKGVANPDLDCVPYDGAFGFSPDAQLTWALYAATLPDAIAGRCGCSTAGQLYATYLEGTGGHFSFKQEGGDCVSAQCAADDGAHQGSDKHPGIERILNDAWEEQKHKVVPLALGADKAIVTIDFIQAVEGRVVEVSPDADPATLAVKDANTTLTYARNDKAGALLLGGGNDNPAIPDSEYGLDTRKVSGTITLVRTDDHSDARIVKFDATRKLRYDVHDALDFCPGNTVKKKDFDLGSLEYNKLLTDLSRLEASGMARDVDINVSYSRTLLQTNQESFNDKPQPPPEPEPPKPAPPDPGPDPKPPGPRPGGGTLKAAVFLEADGTPNPTLEACFEDRARLGVGAQDHEAVEKLQRALVAAGAGNGLGTGGPGGDGVDGVYGEKTAQAVRDFKAREGLGSTQFGDVGPGTMHRLDELLAP